MRGLFDSRIIAAKLATCATCIPANRRCRRWRTFFERHRPVYTKRWSTSVSGYSRQTDGGLKMRIAVTLVGSLLALPASAADWRYLATSTTETDVYVDVTSVRDVPQIPYQRTFPVRQVWSKSDHSRDTTETERETKTMHRFDCSSETMLVISTTGYRANGTVSGTTDQTDFGNKYKPVTPDSIGYAILEFACGRRAIHPSAQ